MSSASRSCKRPARWLAAALLPVLLGASQTLAQAQPQRPTAARRIPPLPPSKEPPPKTLAELGIIDPAKPTLTVEEAVSTSLAQHPSITVAVAAYLAAVAQIGINRSNWLPTVTLSGTTGARYTYTSGLTQPGNPPGCLEPGIVNGQVAAVPCPVPTPINPSTTTVTYTGQLSATQLITDFTHTPALIANGKALARAATGDRDQARAQVALAAVTAYYAVLQAEALYDVAVKTVVQQGQHLDQTKAFLRVGTHPEIDVLTARTTFAQAQLQLLQGQNSVAQTRVLLLQALGITDKQWQTRPLSPTQAAPVDGENRPADDLLDQAIKLRPEMYALRERVLAAEKNASYQRGYYFPQLSAVGSLGYGTGGGAGTLGGYVPPISFTSSIGLQLSWQIFSGLQYYYQAKQADWLTVQARANMEVMRQQVMANLEVALVGVQNARQSLVAAEAVVQQAELALNVAQGRYAAGVGSYIEVTDALVTAQSARAQRVQADFNLATARATLQFQIGNLIPPGPPDKH